MYPPARPIRRDMSYRKPVPRYIPSPPPSPPPSSPTYPINRLSFSLGPALHREMPPLPADWREVIEQALAANKSTRPFLVADEVRNTRSSYGIMQDNFNEELVSSTSTLEITPRHNENCHDSVELPWSPRSPSLSPQNLGRNHNHRLHQNYRPPTPPLPSHYKKRRLPDDDSGFLTSVVPYKLYSPPLIDNPAGLTPTSLRPSVAGTSSQTLTTQPSFRSEASSDVDPSTTWSSGLTTCNSAWDTDPVDQIWHPLPVLPMYNTLSSRRHSITMGPTAIDINGHPFIISGWRERIGVLGTSVRARLRSLTIMVVGAFSCT